MQPLTSPPFYLLAPLLPLLLIGAGSAMVLIGWIKMRQRGNQPGTGLRALTLLTLFLSFDLVVFGAYTRLSDSGLGCPDWPGCYGNASPLGAHQAIRQAQARLPSGPVTHGKAWIEMIHRYLATTVGALIAALAAAACWQHRRYRRQPSSSPPGVSRGWALLTLLWVCVQGAFGALTVTMKLYPAIVTAHLLGGLTLLALLAVQWQRQQPPQAAALPRRLRVAASAVLALAAGQMALGGWVSTHYAALACPDFPTCQGQWWPQADFAQGFTVLRALGEGADGGYLPFAALTAIHLAHRLGAVVLLTALAWLAWRLYKAGGVAPRRAARWLLAIAAWQLASGISNVVLGWPLAAALAHTAGAAGLVILLSLLLAGPTLQRPSRAS